MKIGISNLKWEDISVFETANKAGYDYVESVFCRIPSGIPVKSVQSIFYGSGIDSFEDNLCISYVKMVIDTCEEKGIEAITFGSPKMRVGDKTRMHNFLGEIDQHLDGKNVKFCIEPNSKYYGAEYYNTLSEIVSDLHQYKNISSMIDVGNSILEGQNPIDEYFKYSEYVSHMHFSEKDLNPIENFNVYKQFYNHLLDGYEGLLTYELGSIENLEDNLYNFIKNIKGR